MRDREHGYNVKNLQPLFILNIHFILMIEMFPTIYFLRSLNFLYLLIQLTTCIHNHPTNYNTYSPELSQDTIDGYWDAMNYFDELYPNQSTTRSSNHGRSTNKKEMRPLSEAQKATKE